MKGETNSTAEISITCFNDLENQCPIYETGLYDLDNLMVGFEPGTLTILAGRPSMGKSAIANFLTLQMATKHQLPAIYFSLEMTEKQLQYRLWSLISEFHCYRHLQLTKIRGSRIRQQRAGRIQLDQQEMDSIGKIMDICANLPIFYQRKSQYYRSGYCQRMQENQSQRG